MIPFYNPSLQKVYHPSQVLFVPVGSLFLKDHHPWQRAKRLYSSLFRVKNTSLTSSGRMDSPRLYGEPEDAKKSRSRK